VVTVHNHFFSTHIFSLYCTKLLKVLAKKTVAEFEEFASVFFVFMLVSNCSNFNVKRERTFFQTFLFLQTASI